MKKDLDRRTFLKGATIASAGVVAASALAACSPSTPAEETTDTAATASGEAVNTASQQWSFEIPPEAISDDQIT